MRAGRRPADKPDTGARDRKLVRTHGIVLDQITAPKTDSGFFVILAEQGPYGPVLRAAIGDDKIIPGLVEKAAELVPE